MLERQWSVGRGKEREQRSVRAVGVSVDLLVRIRSTSIRGTEQLLELLVVVI